MFLSNTLAFVTSGKLLDSWIFKVISIVKVKLSKIVKEVMDGKTLLAILDKLKGRLVQDIEGKMVPVKTWKLEIPLKNEGKISENLIDIIIEELINKLPSVKKHEYFSFSYSSPFTEEVGITRYICLKKVEVYQDFSNLEEVRGNSDYQQQEENEQNVGGVDTDEQSGDASGEDSGDDSDEGENDVDEDWQQIVDIFKQLTSC